MFLGPPIESIDWLDWRREKERKKKVSKKKITKKNKFFLSLNKIEKNLGAMADDGMTFYRL